MLNLRRIVIALALAAVVGALVLWRPRTPAPDPSTAAQPDTAPGRSGEPNPRSSNASLPRVEADLNQLRTMPRGNVRTSALLATLDQIGRTDPDRALVLAAQLVHTRDERAFYSAFFARLARDNLAAARRRVTAVPAGESRDNAIRALVDVWARLDFDAAWAWAQQRVDPAERNPAVETSLLVLSGTDPLRAVDAARDQLTGPAFDHVMLAALHQLAGSDPAAAGSLVRLLPAGDVQRQGAADAALALAARDPVAAIRWAGTLPDATAQAAALNTAISGWAARDPAAAATFISSLPAGPQQQIIAVALATEYGQAAPAAAIAWAQSLPAETRAPVLANVASGWARRDPAAATQWAATQTDLSAAALRGAVSYWRLQDPAAAAAWLDSANLPAATKAQLRGGTR